MRTYRHCTTGPEVLEVARRIRLEDRGKRSLAIVNEVDVLLTWNCRHLPNRRILGELGRLVRTMGYELPTVCTPDELMGDVADAEGD